MLSRFDQKSAAAAAGEESGALDPMFRMPVSFGPAAGPRNMPHDRQRVRYVHRRAALTVTALSEESALAALLPPGCTHSGEPLVSVTVTCLTNLAWLAGRGYNIVLVQFPNVTFAGKADTVIGTFVPVLWESLAEPIITGREELGMPKLFAEIPDHATLQDDYFCSASWEGFRFFNLEARGLEAALLPDGVAAPLFAQKYIPQTGNWGAADVDYMTASGPDPTEPPTAVEAYFEGSGEFAFTRARWEDMPTQYTIVNRLCDLPLLEFRGAMLKITTQDEVESRGGGNLFGQRIVS